MITEAMYYTMWNLLQTGQISERLWVVFANTVFQQWMNTPEVKEMCFRMKHEIVR